MNTPSHLERYLSEQSHSGTHDSEGQFTMARAKALEKLAEFQLPFRAAWVLKVVQCAVSSRSGAPIKVELSANEARFFFAAPQLQLAAVEESFFDPEPSECEMTNHLIPALWSVALREKWPFELQLSDETHSLIWDGSELVQVASPRPSQVCRLTVSTRTPSSRGGDWLTRAVGNSAINAEIMQALGWWCYVSPVPLTVDGRRLDSLYGCPSHGPSLTDFPLSSGFGSGDLPQFSLPLRTFETLPEVKDTRPFFSLKSAVPLDGGGLRGMSQDFFQRMEVREYADIPFLLTMHQDFIEHCWRDRRECSRVYWVKDGVVVDQDRLMRADTVCSVAVFLNAAGIPSDATTLQLSIGEERIRRVRLAIGEVARVLQDYLRDLPDTLEELIASGTRKGKALGSGAMALGLAVSWFVPVAGIAFLGGGLLCRGTAGITQRRKAAKIREEVARLQFCLEEELASKPD